MLVDSTRFVVDGWQRVAAAVGRAMSVAEIRERLDGRRTVDILREEFGLTGADAAAIIAWTDDRTADVENGALLPPIAGATEFVRAARAGGWRLALVSSASAANVALALRTLGLEGVFDIEIHAGRTPRGKPAPDPYLLAARDLRRSPGRLVVFEDSLAGLAAAKAAGTRRVGLATTQPAGRLVDAELVIADFRGWTPDAIVAALADGPA